MYRFTMSTDLKLRPVKTIKSMHKHKPSLLDQAIYLDTETSHNHNQDHPKGWLESICFEFNNEIVILRKPSEFIECLKKIKAYYQLGKYKQVIIYIHNLAYDLQFLYNWLIDTFGDDYEVLATGPHKPIYFNIDCFQFRCSYRLSDRSLKKWGKDMNIEHKKLEQYEDFYDKITYQDTRLTKAQLKYQYYDVIALKECMLKQLDSYNDTLYTVVLTKTGYVRREMLRNFRLNHNKNRREFLKRKMDLKTYQLNKDAYSGGYTHGNRFYKGLTLDASTFITEHRNRMTERNDTDDQDGEFRHGDFRSHFPSELRVNGMPCGPWFPLTRADESLKSILKHTDEYCLLIRILISDMKVRRGITFPFAQYSKFYLGKYARDTTFICDNGRILQMDGQSVVVCTEYDIQILMKQYTFDYTIIEVMASKKEMLPQFIADTIDNYFKGKTHYKEVVHALKASGKSDYDPEVIAANIDLQRSKSDLNSCYGCMATDLVQDDTTLSKDGDWESSERTVEFIQNKLERYFASNRNTLSYSFGVFCTSLARYELFQFIEAIGYDNAIYVDTDSIFYYSTPEIQEKIAFLNAQKQARAEALQAFIVTEAGTKVYYDYFGDEGESIQKFRFLHSKCYCYIEKNGMEHLTVAGVRALAFDGSCNRMEELGSIDNLENGFVFKKCGGTTAKYLDQAAHTEVIDGHSTEIASFCIIENTTKTLNDRWEEQDIEYLETYEAGNYEEEFYRIF